MRYIALWVSLLFCIDNRVCHALTGDEKQEGKIQGAEFIIEKQQKNALNQAPKLFFKAPMLVAKKYHKPLAAIDSLVLDTKLFCPTTVTYTPPIKTNEQETVPLSHVINAGITYPWQPYLDLWFYHPSFLRQGNWSFHIAYLPEPWGAKSREGVVALKGRYGMNHWYFETDINYQPIWYQSNLNNKVYRNCYHKLSLQQAMAAPTQKGYVNCNILTYQDKKIKEYLGAIQYKWIKKWDIIAFQLKTYGEGVYYVNRSTPEWNAILALVPRFIVVLSPTMLQCKAGLKLAYHSKYGGIIPRVDASPMFQIHYPIMPWLKLYLGFVSGGVKPLYLHHMVNKNPFIGEGDCKLQHSYRDFQCYFGGKGMLSTQLSYHLHLSFQQVKNLPSIVTDEATSSRYRLMYNPEAQKRFKVVGLLYYALQPQFRASIKGSYYKYFDHNTAPIWWYPKPSFKLKPLLSYQPYPKIAITNCWYLQTKATLKDSQGKATQPDPIIDTSLEGTYFYTPKWAVFLMVGRRQHAYYTGCPDKWRFHVTFGIQYK